MRNIDSIQLIQLTLVDPTLKSSTLNKCVCTSIARSNQHLCIAETGISLRRSKMLLKELNCCDEICVKRDKH